MSTCPIDVAREELTRGVVEDLGINKDKGGRIALYHKTAGWSGSSDAPYCMSFVSYCNLSVGRPSRGYLEGRLLKPGTASCYASQQWHELNPEKLRISFIPGSGAPLPNDIIYLDTDQAGNYNHVGLVEEVFGNQVWTIEGNTSNAGLDNITPSPNFDISKVDVSQKQNDPTKGGVHRRLRIIGKSPISGYGRFLDLSLIQPPPSVPQAAVPAAQNNSSAEIVSTLVALKPEQIKGIQIFLASMQAYQPGENSTVDGQAGPSTRKAMMRVIEKYRS